MKRVLTGIFCVALVLSLAFTYGCTKPATTPPPTPPPTNEVTPPPPPPPAAVDPAATPVEPAATTPAPTGDVKKYTINMVESTIIWNANVTGVGTREGGWSVFEGKIEVTGADLSTTKAEVTVDMKSAFADHTEITKKLLGDEHFFKPGAFPTSTFKTTSIKPSAAGFDVTGDLTIRDKTKTITFPATITLDGANLKVKAEFELNRNDFDIKYQGTVGDYVIADMCPVKLDILCVPAT
ncbi:MAG: YceI family protein [Candidatus Hydrogenedentales bacterium]|jgi:polyisoprenoid-binding protein YceI